jgi:hypothetical protein
MKSIAPILLGLGLAFPAALAAKADDLAVADNPYASIPARNAFNLVPVPAANAPEAAPEPDQSAKITPNGIMCLFGQVQVLFKVASPGQPGQPPQVQSYVMSEGDRADGISVTRIDQPGRLITFDNHGVIQSISLVNAGGVSGSATEPAAPPATHFSNQAVRERFTARDVATPVPAAAGETGASPNPGYRAATSVESAQAKLNAMLNDPDHLSPEAQVVMIEAQRQQLQERGDPAAALIPPTELTQPTAVGGDQNLAGDPPSPTLNP